MNKEILKVLWGNYSKAAKALGITKGAISQWKDRLDQEKVDRVCGASVRTGVYKKELFTSTTTLSTKE